MERDNTASASMTGGGFASNGLEKLLAPRMWKLLTMPRSLRGSLTFRPTALHPELRPVEGGSPGREIKAWQDKDRAIQVTDDGKVLFVVNYNGLSAAIYRLHLDSGDRQLVKTLGCATLPAGSASPASSQRPTDSTSPTTRCGSSPNSTCYRDCTDPSGDDKRASVYRLCSSRLT
jgi:hypothetical protein